MKHKQPQHVSVARPGCQKAAMDRDASSGGILTGYQGWVKRCSKMEREKGG